MSTTPQTHTKEVLVVIVLLVLCVGAYLALNTTTKEPGQIACTADARLCPDGSAVGRVGPLCEFAPCPTVDSGDDGASVQVVETYLREHIGELSTVPAVLGSTFYVTDVTFVHPGELVVKYEDGHIALVADVAYTLTPSREVEVTDFVVRGDAVEEDSDVPKGPSLNLSGKNLEHVSQDVFSRTNLVSLDLSDNNLTGSLPGEIRHLKALRWLDLSHNDFTGVPAEVGQLSELRYLDLSYNNLTGLPYELGNLQNLEVLDLTGNEYATADLAIIKQKLPATVRIRGER